MKALALVLLAQTTPVAEIDAAVNDAIRRGVFPGAVVVVGTASHVLVCKGYGHFTWSPLSPVPSPDSTLFDLASLTKVIATTPAVMRLVDDGRLSLASPVNEYLPGFVGDDKERVTVRHLLEHRSGLRAFLPLNDLTSTADDARRRVLEQPLTWVPDTRVEYSDLNAMLLGWVVESVSATSLDEFATDQVFQPLAMDQTLYKPRRALRRRIAPVGLWRGHAIAGEVHDQNAARLGGVSGHAGLYATGADVARYAQAILRSRQNTGLPLFRPETVRLFTSRRSGHRALGWEMNDTTTADHTGTRLTSEAFGHGGYTGTSLWIDPALDLFIIVLTNRVFAPKVGRSISALKGVRGAIADAAVKLREDKKASPVKTSCEPRAASDRDRESQDAWLGGSAARY